MFFSMVVSGFFDASFMVYYTIMSLLSDGVLMVVRWCSFVSLWSSFGVSIVCCWLFVGCPLMDHFILIPLLFDGFSMAFRRLFLSLLVVFLGCSDGLLMIVCCRLDGCVLVLWYFSDGSLMVLQCFYNVSQVMFQGL